MSGQRKGIFKRELIAALIVASTGCMGGHRHPAPGFVPSVEQRYASEIASMSSTGSYSGQLVLDRRSPAIYTAQLTPYIPSTKSSSGVKDATDDSEAPPAPALTKPESKDEEKDDAEKAPVKGDAPEAIEAKDKSTRLIKPLESSLPIRLPSLPTQPNYSIEASPSDVYDFVPNIPKSLPPVEKPVSTLNTAPISVPTLPEFSKAVPQTTSAPVPVLPELPALPELPIIQQAKPIPQLYDPNASVVPRAKPSMLEIVPAFEPNLIDNQTSSTKAANTTGSDSQPVVSVAAEIVLED